MKRIIVAASVFFLLSISGCWDLQEVDRRSFATTIGIDAGRQGEFSVIVQIPLPQRMMPASGSSTTFHGKAFSTVSISAPTVNEALNILQIKTYRELVIEQNKSIIISENVARRGIKPLIEYFIRNPKAPPQALLFIAHHHTAQEILSFTPVQETLPGLQFISAAQAAVKFDRTHFIAVGQFAPKAIHQATDAYAPLIDLDEKDGLYIEAGLAVFDGFHLAGELDMKEAQLYGLLVGLTKAGNLTIKLPDQRTVSLRNTHGTSSIRVQTSNNSPPHFLIKVHMSGSLTDLEDHRKEITPQDNRQLELAIQKVLEPQFGELIKKLQSFNSDIIDFGEQLRVQHQEEWKRLKWKQLFPKVTFDVEVKVKIDRDGILR